MLVTEEVRRTFVTMDERIDLLSRVAAFASFSPDMLTDLAALLQVEEYEAGTAVMEEGEPVDQLYIIADGRTLITSQTPDGPVVLATQDQAEIFGELALLSPTRRTIARRTALALTGVVLLTLTSSASERLIEFHPEARSIFETPGEIMLVARFLKRVSPFVNVPFQQARVLAGKLEPVIVREGEDIVRQGDPGDVCYLLRAGNAQVLARQEAGSQRRLATLRQGALIGEAALLSDEPRHTTVRALETCELLGLRRDDLLEALRGGTDIAREIFDLLQLRMRPRRMPTIQVSRQRSADGAEVIILKNPVTTNYFRLSPEGWFVWQRLDGDHTMRDLTLAYRDQFGAFVPATITQLTRELAEAGFVQGIPLRREVVDVARKARQETGRLPNGPRDRKPPKVTRSLRQVDERLDRIYRSGVWLLYTRPVQGLLAAIVLLGLVSFALNTVRAVNVVGSSALGVLLLLFLLPAAWVAVTLHEAAHAFTVKAFGREVNRVGVGRHWYGPTTFVDTSDMWPCGRWPRIAVTLAGPYANLVFGAAMALIGDLAPSTVVAALCWEAALASFIVVVVNLNPLLEYDGYYALMDLLNVPNLRSHSLRWLSTGLVRTLHRPRDLWTHRLELSYGLLAVLYALGIGITIILVYQVALQGYLGGLLSTPLSGLLAGILALVLVAVAILSLAGKTWPANRYSE